MQFFNLIELIGFFDLLLNRLRESSIRSSSPSFRGFEYGFASKYILYFYVSLIFIGDTITALLSLDKHMHQKDDYDPLSPLYRPTPR